MRCTFYRGERAEGAQPCEELARRADHRHERLAERVDLVVEGDAVRVTDPAKLQRLAAAWAEKWDGRWRYTVDEEGFRHDVGTALVFAVRPTKVLAFAKGSFSHTRHRF